MIYFLSFFFLFISIKADSKSKTGVRKTEEAIKQIDQLNKPRLVLPDKECQYCPGLLELEEVSEQKRERDLLQQCAVDLCGPVKENPKYIYNNVTFDESDMGWEIAEEFDERIHPTVEKAIQDRLGYENNILTFLKQALENPDTNIKQEEWDKIAEYLYDSNHPAVPYFDNDEERKNFFMEKYRRLLKEYENKETELAEVDREKITQINRELENDNIDVDNFVKNLDELMRQIKIISCSEKSSCRRWVHSRLSTQYQRMIELKRDGSAEDRVSKTIKYCHSKYTAGRMDVLRSRPFRENLEDYKEKFLKKVSSNYSQPSQQAFGDYMNGTLKINFLSGENVNSTFTDGVKKAVSKVLEAPKITSLLQIAQISSDSVMDLNSVCSHSVRSEFSLSSFDFKENAIYMSVFACTFHDVYGEQTLAHELAHVVSYLFADNKLSEESYEEYKKLRQCATERYRVNNKVHDEGGKWRHEHDKYKTEEDTADLFTYQVFQDNPNLSTCSELYKKNGVIRGKRDEYWNLRIVEPKYFSDTTDYNGDTHSEPLLRVIMEAIHKRIELPESCQQIVDIYSDRVNFEPCF